MKKAKYGSRKQIHYLYKTTNRVNGRYYYGIHSTNNLEDGYLGSGTYLKRAINKHGKDNFEIEILKFFDTREELEQAEKTLISEEMIKSKTCYNLKPGGKGGFSREISKKGRIATDKILLEKHGKHFKTVIGKKQWLDMSEEQKYDRLAKLQKGKQQYYEENGGTFTGKKHTEEAKKKMSTSHRVTSKGVRNSQYGTCWITDEVKSRKIKIGSEIPKGWRLGRKIKSKSQS